VADAGEAIKLDVVFGVYLPSVLRLSLRSLPIGQTGGKAAMAAAATLINCDTRASRAALHWGYGGALHFAQAVLQGIDQLLAAEWVNDLAKQFNESQKEYKVVPTYKGSYDENMTAAIAAFRSGNAPHILQVFEVGTATMMASKGAIVPVGKVMSDAGLAFDPKAYIPAVAGYYTAPNGQMLSFPFNSSTTIFYYNKDAFKKAGLNADKAPATWPEVFAAAKKLKASGHSCPMTLAWMGWTQLESFSTWHNVEFATKQNGLAGMDARLKMNSPLHVRHIDNLAKAAAAGEFVYKGRGNRPGLFHRR
jgi:sn-glycerol 3-phosphate transport system substrate-binding protein